MTEKYLRLNPSGDVSWVSIDRVPYEWVDAEGINLDQVYAAIGCDCIEQVSTLITGVAMLIDESGRIRDPQQPFNFLASRLYLPFYRGYADIVGPAILCSVRSTDPYGELDLFPLNAAELAKVSLCLGVQLPDQEV